MSPRLLGDIKTVNVISRFAHLAVALNCVIDSSVMPASAWSGPQIINRGEVLAAYVPSDDSDHVGKYRPYAEAVVTAAFATNSINFTLRASQRGAQWFMPGDVIEATDGTALGTIATYDAESGVGTLAANSTNNLAGDGTKSVRLAIASWTLASKLGLILQDEVVVESGLDLPTSGYREGFFVQSMTSLTTAAISSLSGAIESNINGIAEVRIQ